MRLETFVDIMGINVVQVIERIQQPELALNRPPDPDKFFNTEWPNVNRNGPSNDPCCLTKDEAIKKRSSSESIVNRSRYLTANSNELNNQDVGTSSPNKEWSSVGRNGPTNEPCCSTKGRPLSSKSSIELIRPTYLTVNSNEPMNEACGTLNLNTNQVQGIHQSGIKDEGPGKETCCPAKNEPLTNRYNDDSMINRSSYLAVNSKEHNNEACGVTSLDTKEQSRVKNDGPNKETFGTSRSAEFIANESTDLANTAQGIVIKETALDTDLRFDFPGHLRNGCHITTSPIWRRPSRLRLAPTKDFVKDSIRSYADAIRVVRRDNSSIVRTDKDAREDKDCEQFLNELLPIHVEFYNKFHDRKLELK